MSTLLRRENQSFVLMKLITWPYCSLRLLEILSATFFSTRVHSGPIPPVVKNTIGALLLRFRDIEFSFPGSLSKGRSRWKWFDTQNVKSDTVRTRGWLSEPVHKFTSFLSAAQNEGAHTVNDIRTPLIEGREGRSVRVYVEVGMWVDMRDWSCGLTLWAIWWQQLEQRWFNTTIGAEMIVMSTLTPPLIVI